MEEYACAKRILFESKDLGRAVINIDDRFGIELYGRLAPGVDVTTYRLVEAFRDPPPDRCLEARLLEDRIGSLRLALRSPWGTGELHCNLTGKFNAYNVLAALAALCMQRVPLGAALDALSGVQPVPGRMEAFGGGNRPIVVVDYAHTPDALVQVLSVLRGACRGRLICVFGCGGDRDRGKRPQMGKAAQALADRVVLTSDNPRGEDPNRIIDDIRAGISLDAALHVESDRAAAIRLAVESATPGDVILVAGKGHETYQEIAGRRYPFSDRELVRRMLEEKP
jgi:UDP-N-acetylmuramoyl-L-alanyl-D-glutamate--2,6-diaminopimelate ligase